MDNSDKLPVVKPPTTFQEQVQKMKDRNMSVHDEKFAIDVLQRVNYYRLSGYMLSFKDNDVFKDGTAFEDIFSVYEFDRKLRNLLSGMLELMEVSARTHIAYHLAHSYGSLCYEQSTIYEHASRHPQFIESLNKSIQDARKGHELFVEHHDAKYAGKLPIWSVVELMSFGMLSTFYSNLVFEARKKIAGVYYGVPAFYLRSWWRALAYVRNVCAHHARIYNKPLAISPELFPEDKDRMGNLRIFAYIFILGIICPNDSDWFVFETNLEALIDEYLDVLELRRMGFPSDWRNLLRDTVITRRFTVAASRIRARERDK